MNLNIGNIGVWGFRHYEFLKQNRPSRGGRITYRLLCCIASESLPKRLKTKHKNGATKEALAIFLKKEPKGLFQYVQIATNPLIPSIFRAKPIEYSTFLCYTYLVQ